MPATIFYDNDADLSLLKGKTIAILGYGSQGHAQAQNLKDSGCNVVVGQRPGGPNYELAAKHGFKPLSLEDATKQGDLVNILLPDEVTGDLYKQCIKPNLKAGAILMGSHGFNFMGQLYGCTAANGVWVVPGSHKRGRLDIRTLVDAAGSERLSDAVPIIAEPGDVAITNRQALHGSFANTSPNWRVTLNMGFHRRRSVLGVQGGGVHNKVAVYDEARIRERARLLGYAIDARRFKATDVGRRGAASTAGDVHDQTSAL